MMDMVAFYGARAAVIAPATAPVAGLADAHVTVIANNITVPAQCNKIMGVYAGCAVTALAVPTLAAIISTPKLRSTSLLELTAIDNQLAGAAVEYPGVIGLPLGSHIPFNDFREAPIELEPGEAMQCLTGTQAASAAENVRCIVMLTDGVLANPFTGRIETVIADAAAPAVVNAWTPTAVVFRQVLRAGTYAVVGMKASGQSMTAARLIFGNQGARPGVIANSGGAGYVGNFIQQDFARGMFRYGRSGVWGTFTHTNPPVVEVLCQVADAAATMHFALDVIKIA